MKERIFSTDSFLIKRGRIINNLLTPNYEIQPTGQILLRKARNLITEGFKDWNKLDAIIVLGASMDFSTVGRRWKLGGIIESDPSRVVGGFSRAVAAKQLSDEGFEGIFAVTGGTQVAPDGEIASRAEVLAQAIARRNSVEEDNVVSIGQDGHGNTLGNVTDTIEFLDQNDGLLTHRQIGLLTNAWQMPRSLLFFLDNPYFEQHDIELKPIIADDIVRQKSTLHALWVDAFNSHPEMQERLRKEQQGIEAFFNGSYSPISY